MITDAMVVAALQCWFNDHHRTSWPADAVRDMRALLEGYERDQWWSIEEAPRDGEPLYVDTLKGVRLAYWCAETGEWHDWEAGLPLLSLSAPTHYRPLPAPPKE